MSLRCCLTQAKNILDSGGIGISYGMLHTRFSSQFLSHISVIGCPKTLLHPHQRIYRMQRYAHRNRVVNLSHSGRTLDDTSCNGLPAVHAHLCMDYPNDGKSCIALWLSGI